MFCKEDLKDFIFKAYFSSFGLKRKNGKGRNDHGPWRKSEVELLGRERPKIQGGCAGACPLPSRSGWGGCSRRRRRVVPRNRGGNLRTNTAVARQRLRAVVYSRLACPGGAWFRVRTRNQDPRDFWTASGRAYLRTPTAPASRGARPPYRRRPRQISFRFVGGGATASASLRSLGPAPGAAATSLPQREAAGGGPTGSRRPLLRHRRSSTFTSKGGPQPRAGAAKAAVAAAGARRGSSSSSPNSHS